MLHHAGLSRTGICIAPPTCRLAGAPARRLGPCGGRLPDLERRCTSRAPHRDIRRHEEDSRSANDESFSPTARCRALASVDVLRGLIIVIMALDHVRDYFTDVRFNPLDPTQTTAMLYATRWITNFCAPVFVLLAGVSAYLVGRRCTTREAQPVSVHAWAVARGPRGHAHFGAVDLQFPASTSGSSCRWCGRIGLSMVVLSGLVYLPVRVVGTIGVAICVFHNLLDGVPMPETPLLKTLWAILHVRESRGDRLRALPADSVDEA